MLTDTFVRSVDDLRRLFERPVCVKGFGPIRKGVEIAVHLAGEGPATLGKSATGPEVRPSAPAKPDMTFHVPAKALEELLKQQTEDVGDIGVAILKLMANGDPAYRIHAKVHIGAFDLLRNGYLGVLPLGGPAVMRFLSSKGFTGIGKIKDAIQRLRT